MTEISCVMPTYNRSDMVTQALAALLKQSYAGAFEVVIVDDGSSDNTREVIAEFIAQHDRDRVRWVYLHQEHRGPAAARNKGVTGSQGEYVVFLGDDMLAGADFLKEHLNLLRKDDKIISLGLVSWHPRAGNPRLKVFNITGIEVDYERMSDTDNCDFNYFCTANVALKRKHLLEERFDEDFLFPALEDTELGYRLHKRGLVVKLNKKSRVYHFHHYEVENLFKRQENIGLSLALLIRKHPQLREKFLKPYAYPLYLLCSFLSMLRPLRHVNLDFYWSAVAIASKYRAFYRALDTSGARR